MDDYQELIEQLRKGFGSAAGRATQVNFYHMWCHKAADAIESLQAELNKYRDAPVVAYQHRDRMLSCRLPGGGVPGIDWAPLIVKPGEEK